MRSPAQRRKIGIADHGRAPQPQPAQRQSDPVRVAVRGVPRALAEYLPAARRPREDRHRGGFQGTRWTVNAVMLPTPRGSSYLMPVGSIARLFKNAQRHARRGGEVVARGPGYRGQPRPGQDLSPRRQPRIPEIGGSELRGRWSGGYGRTRFRDCARAIFGRTSIRISPTCFSRVKLRCPPVHCPSGGSRRARLPRSNSTWRPN